MIKWDKITLIIIIKTCFRQKTLLGEGNLTLTCCLGVGNWILALVKMSNSRWSDCPATPTLGPNTDGCIMQICTEIKFKSNEFKGLWFYEFFISQPQGKAKISPSPAPESEKRRLPETQVHCARNQNYLSLIFGGHFSSFPFFFISSSDQNNLCIMQPK